MPKDGERAARTYALPTDEFKRFADLTAGRVGEHAFNVTQAYLSDNAVRELSPDSRERKKPDIPSVSAFASTAGKYVGRPFSYGREQIIRSIENQAESRGLPATIIAEYSSILDEMTPGWRQTRLFASQDADSMSISDNPFISWVYSTLEITG